MNRTVTALLLACGLLLVGAETASARDWYVSIARGKGKKGSKKKPAKDLGNILSKLSPGDTVHIAEGIYMGRGKNGSNTITVPISIIGGYDDTFSKRDPWGKHRTVFAGDNMTKNYPAGGPPAIFMDLMKFTGDAVPITVDGVIVDHGYRNRYTTKEETKLAPMANPKTGQNPSPGMGALVIRVQKSAKFDRGPRWTITVKNCIVMNAYQNQGALSVSGYKGSKITITNNAVIQSSGAGIFLGSKFHGDAKDYPTFVVENNTVLFSWDSGFSQGFNIHMDTAIKATLKNNVFGFSDIYGINNDKKVKDLLLVGNLIVGARKADYVESNMKMSIEEIEDEADLLHEDTTDNISKQIKVPVSEKFALLYGSRVVVDRAKAEAGVKASNSSANDLRKMLGLPTKAGAVKWPKSPVYINRISIDDAVKAASTKYHGKGSTTPK
jgi:hypothetical protein